MAAFEMTITYDPEVVRNPLVLEEYWVNKAVDMVRENLRRAWKSNDREAFLTGAITVKLDV